MKIKPFISESEEVDIVEESVDEIDSDSIDEVEEVEESSPETDYTKVLTPKELTESEEIQEELDLSLDYQDFLDRNVDDLNKHWDNFRNDLKSVSSILGEKVIDPKALKSLLQLVKSDVSSINGSISSVSNFFKDLTDRVEDALNSAEYLTSSALSESGFKAEHTDKFSSDFLKKMYRSHVSSMKAEGDFTYFASDELKEKYQELDVLLLKGHINKGIASTLMSVTDEMLKRGLLSSSSYLSSDSYKKIKQFDSAEALSMKIELFVEGDDLYAYISDEVGGLDKTTKHKAVDIFKKYPHILDALKKKGFKTAEEIIESFGKKKLSKIDVVLDIDGDIKEINKES